MVRDKTKSGKARRVPIDQVLIERLRNLRASTQTLPYVSASEKGRPLRTSHLINNRLHPLLKELDLDQCGFHRFRHTYASILLQRGIDVATVAKILGHANPSITLSIYAHVIPGREREAAEAIGAALGTYEQPDGLARSEWPGCGAMVLDGLIRATT